MVIFVRAVFLPIWKFIKTTKYLLIAFAAYCLIFYFMGWQSCLVKLIFGVPCPFCGMTRAVINVITFHPIRAFYFNPMVYLLPFIMIVLIYYENKYISKIYKSKSFWIILFVIFIGSYIIRMIMFYPQKPLDLYDNSLLFRVIRLIKRYI